MAKPGRRPHIGDARSTAAPRTCAGRRLALPHLPRLVNQKTETHHGREPKILPAFGKEMVVKSVQALSLQRYIDPCTLNVAQFLIH